MDPGSVITLGHKANQPLMYPSGELTDGSEPHDHICSAGHPCAPPSMKPLGGRGVPGVGQLGGYWVGLYRVLPSRSIIKAYLMNY